MPYKYLYIDDTKDDIETGTINGLQDGDEILVDFKKPSNWENLIEELINILPEHDGIILDLRLNDNAYEDGRFAQYKGSTVAQELRSLAKENKLEDLPIILYSGTYNIEHYLDPTSLDLFDAIVDKNKLEHPNYMSFNGFRKKLKWLSDGYAFIKKSDRSINTVLNIADLSFIDLRFVELFQELLTKPVHIISRFLEKQVIFTPGFLIDENYLSARLGLDRNSADWISFKEAYLKRYEYSGAFSNYYPRWWMYLIDKFWNEQISSDFPLRNTSASKRVELIIQKTRFKNLQPIAKQSKSKSDSFWVVCKATNVAIDTVDGFTISRQDAKYPWQEPQYISIDEALRPTGTYGVSTMEKPRLQKLKEVFEKNEQRIRK